MVALTGSTGTSPVNSLQTRSTAASIGRLQEPVLGAFPVSRTSYRHLSSVTLRRVPDLVDCPVEGVDQGRRERSPFLPFPVSTLFPLRSQPPASPPALKTNAGQTPFPARVALFDTILLRVRLDRLHPP